MEQTIGFEPTTNTLATCDSTTELRLRSNLVAQPRVALGTVGYEPTMILFHYRAINSLIEVNAVSGVYNLSSYINTL